MARRRLVTTSLAAVALVAVGLALASCGGDDGDGSQTRVEATTDATTTTETTETVTTTEPEAGQATVVRVVVRDGAPQGGIVRETVDQGVQVVLVVRSDVADHVHVHGYDRFADVAPGGTARIRLRATIPGRFEVELEERGLPIAELTVEP